MFWRFFPGARLQSLAESDKIAMQRKLPKAMAFSALPRNERRKAGCTDVTGFADDIKNKLIKEKKSMKLKSKKSALLLSFTSLLLCFAMLAGSTFAWFTDTATTGVNKIVSGKLKVDIVDEKGDHLNNLSFQDKDSKTDIRWEPGVKFLTQGFKIKNDGNLALKWKMAVNKGVKGETDDFDLKDVIDFSIVTIDNTTVTPVEKEVNLAAFEGKLPSGMSEVYYLKGHMQESAGNDYQNLSLNNITVTVYATQDTVENDSFNNTYDENATYYPVLDAAGLKNALVNGGNIKVDNDVDTGKDVMAVTKDTTLDMNGKTIKNTEDIWTGKGEDGNWSLISARNGANLTITGNGTFKAKENDAYTVDVQNGSTVTIKNGTFISNVSAVYVTEGTAIIEGGHFSIQQLSDFNDCRYLLNCLDENYSNKSAKIIVKGGTFVNYDPSHSDSENPQANFVAEGYSVISEQHGADTWYTVVKGKGVVAGSQSALNNAIQDNNSATVKLTEAGAYTLPEMSGKDVTIVGTKDTVIDVSTSSAHHGATIALEGVTVKGQTSGDYAGLQHTAKVVYKDCKITGKQTLYANEVEFINCKFVQDAVDYNVWTYGAGKVLFKNCEFECKGKAVLIYREGDQQTEVQTVEFQNCKFNASALAKGKAAIEIDSSLVEKGYTVTIDKATADSVTGFDNGSVSGNTVWNNKKGTKATVIVNGETVLAAK